MSQSTTIAYLRVSTIDQDLEKNKFQILPLANEKGLGQVQWVEEKVTSRVSWRKRQIATILDQLQSGDNLIISELSRLGRSMLECMEILSIASQKGIHLYAVKVIEIIDIGVEWWCRNVTNVSGSHAGTPLLKVKATPSDDGTGMRLCR